MVYITSHISGYRKTWSLLDDKITLKNIIDFISIKEGCNDEFSIWDGRKRVSFYDSEFPKDSVLVATLKLNGGKGGFGSMLRAIGAQIEKTTNREACRDLSGRRLRDINEEKRLKDFLAKKAEKEKETLELKKKKLEQLKEGQKHYFEDKSYFEQREKTEQDIYDSIDKAFSPKNSNGETSGVGKRKCGKQKSVLVKKTRLMDDLDESSEESDEEGTSSRSSNENDEQNSISTQRSLVAQNT